MKRMFLHAHSISFNHPLSGEAMTLVAPLAEELVSFVDKLIRIV